MGLWKIVKDAHTYVRTYVRTRMLEPRILHKVNAAWVHANRWPIPRPVPQTIPRSPIDIED